MRAIDVEVARVAGRQDGIVTRRQLLRPRRDRRGDPASAQGGPVVRDPSRRVLGRARQPVRPGPDPRGPARGRPASDREPLHGGVPAPGPLRLARRCPPHGPRRRPTKAARASRSTRPGRPRRRRESTASPATTPLRTLEDLGFPDPLTREALAQRLIRPEQLPPATRTPPPPGAVRPPPARAARRRRAAAAPHPPPRSAAMRRTSRGPGSGWRSRPTAGARTATGRRSSATAPATRTSPRAAGP